MADPIIVVDYDPSWPERFVFFQRRIARALGSMAAAIEHVGSTAVPDLPAKPIIEGRWDFTMRWTPDETQFADVPEPVRRPADEANEPPPLFTAIQKQLGLKLEAQKADVPVLVVDHVDHPSPN